LEDADLPFQFKMLDKYLPVKNRAKNKTHQSERQ